LYKAIYKDDRRWLNQVKLFWMASNPQVTKELDSQEWRKKLKQFSNGVAYIPDVKTYSHKVEVIEKTGLLDFLNPFEEFTEDSPKVKQFLKDCHRHRKKLKSAFGISLSKDYPPIKLLNRLLDKIGLKMKFSRSEKQGELKIRYYKLSQNELYDTDRLAVIESLNQKFKNEPAKHTQTQSQQASQPGHELNNCLYKNETSVPENKPEEKVLQDVVNSPNSQFEKWNSAETVADVSSMLDCCENEEMLSELMECDIPSDIFRIAARQLPVDKREQIRQWLAVSSA
ncbi:MAG: hypothetical protein WA933_21700, partial [Microcoleaceae cyanobacterium]